LYEQGWKRVGCIGCPMANSRKELNMFPKYRDLYFKAAAIYWERRKARQVDQEQLNGMMASPESYFEWWLQG